MFFPGSISENHREEWLPGIAMGTLHHAEWRLPAENTIRHHVTCYHGNCQIFM